MNTSTSRRGGIHLPTWEHAETELENLREIYRKQRLIVLETIDAKPGGQLDAQFSKGMAAGLAIAASIISARIQGYE